MAITAVDLFAGGGFGSLFSGIGLLDLGLRRAGLGLPVWRSRATWAGPSRRASSAIWEEMLMKIGRLQRERDELQAEVERLRKTLRVEEEIHEIDDIRAKLARLVESRK